MSDQLNLAFYQQHWRDDGCPNGSLEACLDHCPNYGEGTIEGTEGYRNKEIVANE